MKKVIKASRAYDNPNYHKATDTYMPSTGEGDNMATQCVTAINRLVYKWYNDGDVYDNRYALEGWANDISDEANWLYKYIPKTRTILDMIETIRTENEYEGILSMLVDTCMDMEDLEKLAEKPAKGSIYECKGPYEFVEWTDEDEEAEWDYWN